MKYLLEKAEEIKLYNPINYKETPIPNIYNLKENSYIYINQNQKTIEKNILNVKTTYKIGLKDLYHSQTNLLSNHHPKVSTIF